MQKNNQQNQIRQNSPEVADIFLHYGKSYRKSHNLSFQQLKVMHHIQVCRTAILGGHIQQCDQCGFQKPVYNSCRNRHCPKCQTMAKERWLKDRHAELLPTGYFHLVFTLPHEVNCIVHCNPNKLLNMLFASASETLQAFAKDPQWRLEGQLGFIGVLHTWTQTLMDHFHLHCLIPAGALCFDKDRWIPSRKKFLFHVKSLAKEFRKRYLFKLETAFDKKELIFAGNTAELGKKEEFKNVIDALKAKDWIVYAKRPFGGPKQVLDYLGRYTHRVAISNHRIISVEDGKVTFSYKDRSDGNKAKTMKLEAEEFIRRFLLHVLPNRFMKIRYFGFLFNRNRKKNIELIRGLIGTVETGGKKTEEETVEQMMIRLAGIDITLCPHCGKGKMRPVIRIPNRLELLKVIFNST